MAIKSKIQLRRDTLANWESTNPVLEQGEIALVDKNNSSNFSDPLWVIRIGDGTHSFTQLPETAYALRSELSDIGELSIELENLELSVSTLSAEISSKVKIENVPTDYINISRVDAETYHQIITGGTADEKTVYIVSSDNINAFGEKVINVGDATELSDAVNLKQLNAVSEVVDAISTDLYELSGKFETLDSSLSDYEIGISSLGRTGDVFKYQLTQGGQNVGDPIEVPYDVFVDKGEIQTIGDKKYLLLTLNNEASTVLSIETTDLVDVYTGASTDTISVNVSNYSIGAVVNSNSIDTGHIKDNAITTGKILSASVTPDKLDPNGVFVFDCGSAQ